ncbi:MAG: serine/threonine-protein phosphatase [Acidimicrobiales bacterium]|nr:serine/threonine-protein phosphatase [Acidimicrobiales bacterium]
MDPISDRATKALLALLDGSHLAQPDELPGVIRESGLVLGWEVTVYLADYEQSMLHPFLNDGSALSIQTTEAGAAYRRLLTVEVPSSTGRTMWVPIVDGVERLGVLEIGLPPDVDAAAIKDELRWFAHLVGHLLGSKQPYGDSMHQAREREQRSVASELIWSLLPPLTMACEGLVIAAVLEPAHSVAGDVFDYAVNHGVAHVGIFDGTGHDLHSGVIGAIALAAYRNTRRMDNTLLDAANAIDATLQSFAEDTYATGVLTQLDVRTGVLTLVNAGHPSPLLVRDARVVSALDGGRRPLFGLTPRTEVTAETVQLQAGDWVLLYTDGVVEARDRVRAFFGEERFVSTIERIAAERLPAPETVRLITKAVMDHQHDVLQDDATMVVIQWGTGNEHDMEAGHGL